jgi:RNase H-like domain found in reverse transcriptase
MTDILTESFACRSAYSSFDLYVSFDQWCLDPRSRNLTTFSSPLGAIWLTVIPMGYTNSPQIIHSDVAHILHNEIPDYTQHFIDDVPVKGPLTRYELPGGGYETIDGNPGIQCFIWELCLATHYILQWVKVYGGTFNGKKSFIGLSEAVVVGHLCTYHGYIPDTKQVQKIISWPRPTTLTEVGTFLGTCGVLQIFIKNFTLITQPLVHLIWKDVPFEFGDEEDTSMEKLKQVTVTSPALQPLNYVTDRAIILAVDSSPVAAGYILSQIGDDDEHYLNWFGSITFNDRESHYSQVKLELYGLF